MSSRKKVIYTCITGEYDGLYNHQYVDEEWDYVCFSDSVVQTDLNSSWRILPLKDKSFDDQRINRWHKINAHLCVGDYEDSIYIDGNIDILSKDFFDEIKKQKELSSIFSVMAHPARDCLYQEALACIELGKDTSKNIEPQMEVYRRDRYPEHNGLYTNSILYRKHNNKKVIKMMNEWWTQLRDYSRRDQLSLPYIFWKNKFKPHILPFSYDIGKVGPLFYYPHTVHLRGYVRDLYEQIETLTRKEKSIKNDLESIESRLALIEESRLWRLRGRLMDMLRKIN